MRPGDSEFRAFKFDVLRIQGGLIAEITTFGPELLQSMCKQSGYGRVAFYGATEATAAKIK